MPQGGKESPIAPNLVARVAQAARYVINGGSTSAWFGPSQPLTPSAPQGVEGRQFDYPVGMNLDTRKRGGEPISFEQLRFLADNCEILRAVIETRKDQMEAMDWTIRVRQTADKGVKAIKTNDAQKKRIDAITTFLQSPDRVNTWSQWQRQLLEDRFVIDAAALYKRRDRGGRLYGLEILDGSTLKILIDDTGRRPMAPDPAYQQILKGVPAVNYSADEVMYLMRNPRSWKAYGYSEVEQVLITVNTEIRRALSTLEYYTEGSQPDAFLGMPKEWTPDQIRAFQTHMDSMLSGNTAARRRLRMIPDGGKYQETKQPPLKDMYDEWLARKICFVFSISPEPFVQHTNKGTAETAHDRAQQEGLAPLQRWIKGVIDPVLALDFESPDLEFSWVDDREMDPAQADTILVNDTKAGIISIDEAREAKGLDPIGGACATPMALTTTGYVVIDPEERAAMTPLPQPAFGGKAGDDPANDNAAAKPQEKQKKPAKAVQKAAYTRLGKAVRHEPIPLDRKVTRASRKALKTTLTKVLTKAGKQAAAQVRGELGKMAKADEDAKAKAARIAAGLDLSAFSVLTDTVPDDLENVATDSGTLALAQLGVEDRSELVDQVSERAVSYARKRGAEMVGKRYDADGNLIENPNAAWRIDEATRDELQGVIRQGLEDNIGSDAIADAIQEAGAFSEDRARLIADTEIAKANSQGTLEGYKAARDLGIKVKKVWLPDSDPCPDCQENADAGPIDLDDDFPSGDDAAPAHPRCECAITNEVEEDEE